MVVWAVTHYRHYLYGKPFTLVTDHQPLEWLLTTNKLTSKHARWALILQEYDFKIVHRPGLRHANADECSRHPLPTTVDNGARRNHDAGESDKTNAEHGQQWCGRGILLQWSLWPEQRGCRQMLQPIRLHSGGFRQTYGRTGCACSG